jgi:hypothetical protein
MAVARQRPATANGVVFMLLEDEFGQVNLIVPPQIYERLRAIVRGEPLILARGVFERVERNQNVLVHELETLAPSRASSRARPTSSRRSRMPTTSAIVRIVSVPLARLIALVLSVATLAFAAAGCGGRGKRQLVGHEPGYLGRPDVCGALQTWTNDIKSKSQASEQRPSDRAATSRPPSKRSSRSSRT